MSKIQVVIALLTTKVKYMATIHARKEAIWLHRLYIVIGFKQQSMRINCVCHSAIFLANNLTCHPKMNHIDVQYHFMRDMVENKKVLLEKVHNLKTL
jgi:hypothetical protein